MRLLFAASVPKYAELTDQNEDSAAANQYRGLYAVSDGASESYDSKTWSRLLATRFVDNPDVNAAWVRDAVSTYALSFDRDAMSWSAQAAFDRGSFATLIGVRTLASGTVVRVLGIGDSVAVLADRGRLKRSFPYTSPEQFRSHPRLLSTLHERNQDLIAQGNALTTEWRLRGLDKPIILLMTDALGAWLLAQPQHRLGRLLALPSKPAFAHLVEAERSLGAMRRDDCTLLRIG